MQKLFGNTAVGHFIYGLLVVVGLAVLNYLVNDPAIANALVNIGIPVVVVKGVVDLIRTSVPNI